MSSLQSVEVLIAVVQCQSFRAAAQRLGLAQSVVSAQLRALEEWLGFELLHASRRAGALSIEGEGAYLCALRLQQRVQEMQQALDRHRAVHGAATPRELRGGGAAPTLKQLRALSLVAELGTLERAAQRLNVTAAAVARRLQELQWLCAAPLFAHPRRKDVLSETGQRMLAHAQAIGQAHDALAALRQHHKAAVTVLNIGITELVALTWFPAFVRQMRSAYPHIALHPDVDLAVNLRAKLLRGELDVALLPEGASDPRLASVPAGAVAFAWFCAPGTFAAAGRVSLAELVEQPLLVQGRGSGLNAVTDALFARHGLQPKQVFGSNSLVALAGLVESGIGIACLPQPLFQHLVQMQRLAVVATTAPMPQARYCTSFVKSSGAALGYVVASIARKSCDFEPPAPRWGP